SHPIRGAKLPSEKPTDMDTSTVATVSSMTSPFSLAEVTIKRFRSLYDIGPIRLQEGLTIVTGENDGGKSATIDAIAFLLNAMACDDGDHSQWATDDEPLF